MGKYLFIWCENALYKHNLNKFLNINYIFDLKNDINLTQWHSDFFPDLSKKRSWKNINNLKVQYLNSVTSIPSFTVAIELTWSKFVEI